MVRFFRFTPLLGILLLTGCLRSCSGEVGTVPGEQGAGRGGETVGTTPSASGAALSSVASEELSSSSSSAEETASSSAASMNTRVEPSFIPLTLEWTLDVRTLLAHISKLKAIEEQRYSLKEGEKKPDLRQEFVAVDATLSKIDAMHDNEKLRALMHELRDDAGTIVRELSDPPLLAELQKAEKQKSALTAKITALYAFLQKGREEATTGG